VGAVLIIHQVSTLSMSWRGQLQHPQDVSRGHWEIAYFFSELADVPEEGNQ